MTPAVLQKQSFPIIFEGGQDTKTDPRHVIPAKVLLAENLYRAQSKAWAKRWGTTSLATTVSGSGRAITTGVKLTGRDKELLLQTSESLYNWNPDLSFWTDIGTMGSANVKVHFPVITPKIEPVFASTEPGGSSGTADLHTPDAAFGAGLILDVWQDGTTIKYSIIEESTRQTLRNNVSVGTGYRPKAVYADGYFTIFSASTTALQYWRIDPTTFATTNGNINTDLFNADTGNWFDVQARGDTPNVLVCYRSNTPTLKALEWDPSANAISIAAVVVVASDVCTAGLSWLWWDHSNSNAYLVTAVNGVTGVVSRVLSKTTLAQTASTTEKASPGDVANLTGWFDTATSKAIVVYEVRNTTTMHLTQIFTATNGSATIRELSVGLASKAILMGSIWYVMVSLDSLTGSSYFLLSLFNTAGASRTGESARFLRGNGGGLTGGDSLTSDTSRRNALPFVSTISATKFVCPMRKRTDIISFPSLTPPREIKHGIVNATLDFAAVPGDPRPFAESLFIPGALPRVYDGASLYEIGFNTPPEPPSLALVAGAGLQVGAYQYCTVFERMDRAGRRWQSQPSTPVSITTTGGNQQVNVTVFHNRITGQRATYENGDCSIVVYRTLLAGTIFFRHAKILTSSANSDSQVLLDQLTDTDVGAGEPLYTSANVLPNLPPPPCLDITQQGNRVIVLDAEDRRKVWASTELQPGRGIGFHDNRAVSIDADGDNFAVEVLDGRIYVFKRAAIYVITGAWPNDQGQGDLPTAERVSNALGTIEPESVVATPDGIWFKDPAKGLCFLDRGGNAQVVPDLTAYDSLDVSASVLHPSLPQVRFTTATGRTLIWDYSEKQWYTYTGWLAASATVVNGVFYYVTSAGVVLAEDSTTYQDAGVNFTCKQDVSWLQMPGLLGEQWIDWLQIAGDHFGGSVSLLVRFYYDFEESIVVTRTYAISGISSNGKYVVQAELTQPRNKAVRVRLEFSTDVQGLTLAGMAAYGAAMGHTAALAKAAIL